MRLKTIVGVYVISTIQTSRERTVTGVPLQFETVVFSDDDKVHLHNGEMIVAYSQNEFTARINHQMTVDWVWINDGKLLRNVVPPRLAQL